mmetsp:Transcript_26126/g.78104  ORF Transcript_26126/g.78104 Transcript_26126/m.78104 type:complete len:280 (-) Transcript_26126:87-926(-)
MVRVLQGRESLHVGAPVIRHHVSLHVTVAGVEERGSTCSSAERVLPCEGVARVAETVEGRVEVCTGVKIQCHTAGVVHGVLRNQTSRAVPATIETACGARRLAPARKTAVPHCVPHGLAVPNKDDSVACDPLHCPILEPVRMLAVEPASKDDTVEAVAHVDALEKVACRKRVDEVGSCSTPDAQQLQVMEEGVVAADPDDRNTASAPHQVVGSIQSEETRRGVVAGLEDEAGHGRRSFYLQPCKVARIRRDSLDLAVRQKRDALCQEIDARLEPGRSSR